MPNEIWCVTQYDDSNFNYTPMFFIGVRHPMPEMKQMWFRYDKQTDRAYEIEPPVYNKIYKYAF